MPWLHWPRDEPRQTFPTCLTCSLNLAEAGFILIGKKVFSFAYIVFVTGTCVDIRESVDLR